jgi:hypothetical protein
VKDYLIAITWVDDVRYFGTEKFVKQYEDDVVKKIDEAKIVEYVNDNFDFVTDEDKETIIKQFKEELND